MIKEIYYEKFKYTYNLMTEMFYDDRQLVNVHEVKTVAVKFPNYEVESVDFIAVDERISDRDASYRDMNFIISISYKGMAIEVTARELISKGCKVFIEF